MKEITSVQNERIKTITKLHSAKGRKELGLFLAEGERVLESFSRSQHTPTYVFVTAGMVAQAQQLFDTEPLLVTDAVMKKLSTATTPSGILAVFPLPKTSIKIEAGLVLSNITDPGNMGTLIRSAAAFGSRSITIIDGCDPYAPKVVQASAGTLAQVTIVQCSWQELVKNKKDIKLCALVVSGGSTPEEIKQKDLLLVVGNEAHGLSQPQIDDCQLQLTLPMNQTTESLNAAVAGSLALYLCTH